jgi:signal transduction histidine kinase
MIMTQSESDLLNQRLTTINVEKALLLKRLRELEAQEARIKYALGVLRDALKETRSPSN